MLMSARQIGQPLPNCSRRVACCTRLSRIDVSCAMWHDLSVRLRRCSRVYQSCIFYPCEFVFAFSSPAFSTHAIWSRVFQFCVFHFRVFSRPVVVDGRARWRHLYDTRRVLAVYCSSVNCNPLSPLHRFAVDLLYNFVSTDKILTDTARCAVRLR